MMRNFVSEILHKHFKKFFPPTERMFGIARVKNIEEVFIKESVFYDKNLVLCINIPPQLDYYLITLTFKEKDYPIKSYQIYPENKEVVVEYVQKIWGIQKIKIIKKSLVSSVQ